MWPTVTRVPCSSSLSSVLSITCSWTFDRAEAGASSAAEAAADDAPVLFLEASSLHVMVLQRSAPLLVLGTSGLSVRLGSGRRGAATEATVETGWFVGTARCSSWAPLNL